MSLVDDIVALGTQAPAVVGGLVRVVKAVGPVLPTIQMVFDDPAFPRVIAQIKELHEIEAGAPSAPGVPAPPAAKAGIGLNKAVPLLDAVIYARRNPWAPWVIGGLVLLLIGGVGYKLGRRRS
jgi:hypothetical protein